MSIEISVIIPTYKDWESLRKCLGALANQSIGTDRFEVIVVNNDANSSYRFNPEEFQLHIKLYHQKIPGSYAARNLGIQEAQGRILAFTDSDCIPDREWLKNGVMQFESHKEISRIGGRVEVYRPEEGSRVSYEYERWLAFDQRYYVSKRKAAVTANMFALTDVFTTTGLFDQSALSGGDIEWGERAASSQSKIVYAPEVVVGHPSRKSLLDLAKKRRRTTAGIYRTRFHTMNFKRKLIFLALMIFPPVHFMRKVNASLFWKIIIVASGWFLGLSALLELTLLVIKRTEGNRS